MSKKTEIIIFTGFIIACLVLIVLVGGCSTTSSTPAAVVVSDDATPELSIAPNPPTQEIVTIDLAGTWTTKINDTVFTVDVANSVVKIIMSNNGRSMLYWYGSISNTGTVGEIITSTKMEFNKAVLSSADSKTFAVGKNTLTFEVSAMGKTRSVAVVHV